MASFFKKPLGNIGKNKVVNAVSGIATGGLATSGGGGLLQGNNPIDTLKSISGGQTSSEAAQQAKDEQARRDLSVIQSLDKGKQEGLAVAREGYGQDLAQTGQDIQRIKGLQRARTDQSGSDPVSAAIMGQKLSSQANARRELNSKGVSGGAAAGAIEEVGRQKDSDIAASLYGQQRQSMADERSLASNTLSGTASLMSGQQGLQNSLNQPNLPQASGLMDSVICTELYSQGIMSKELYAKDSEYGRILKDTMPHTIVGYHSWAKPTVKLMKKSKLFTKIISYPAMKWAKHIAREESSLVGYVCQNIGEPICNILGRIITLSYGVSYGL